MFRRKREFFVVMIEANGHLDARGVYLKRDVAEAAAARFCRTVGEAHPELRLEFFVRSFYANRISPSSGALGFVAT